MISWVMTATVVALAAGCTEPTRQDRGEVLGTVRLDGKPVAGGTIIFKPGPTTYGLSAVAEIVDGKYHIPVDKGPAVGENIVQFTGARKTGGIVISDGEWQQEWVEIFPPEYGDASKEVRRIEPGRNVIDFNLTTPKPSEMPPTIR
jgi:hypothetical protein